MREISTLAQPPSPFFPCGYTINFEKSEVICIKKYERPHLKNLLPPCPKNASNG